MPHAMLPSKVIILGHPDGSTDTFTNRDELVRRLRMFTAEALTELRVATYQITSEIDAEREVEREGPAVIPVSALGPEPWRYSPKPPPVPDDPEPRRSAGG